MQRYVKCPRCGWIYGAISAADAARIGYSEDDCQPASKCWPVCGAPTSTFAPISSAEVSRILPVGVTVGQIVMAD